MCCCKEESMKPMTSVDQIKLLEEVNAASLVPGSTPIGKDFYLMIVAKATSLSLEEVERRVFYKDFGIISARHAAQLLCALRRDQKGAQIPVEFLKNEMRRH